MIWTNSDKVFSILTQNLEIVQIVLVGNGSSMLKNLQVRNYFIHRRHDRIYQWHEKPELYYESKLWSDSYLPEEGDLITVSNFGEIKIEFVRIKVTS